MTDEPTELSPEARALLAQASGGDDPSPADRARVRRTLMATIAGGAGLAASSAASSAAASAGAAGTGAVASATISLTVQIAAVLVAGAVGSVVIIAPWEQDEPPARSLRVVPAPQPRERAEAEAEPRALPEPPTSQASADELVLPEPLAPVEPAAVPAAIEPAALTEERATTPRPSTPRASTPGAARAPPPSAARERPVEEAAVERTTVTEPEPVRAPEPALAPAPSTLAAEVALLRSAQAALNAGDHDVALARLAEHARRFPNGTMAEEREAARVLALCRADRRDDAHAAAAFFLRERPSSPLAARVRASCD